MFGQNVKFDNSYDLLPCPFCGSEATLVKENVCTDLQFSGDNDYARIMCKKCGAQSKEYHVTNARFRETCNKELDEICLKAVRSWNKRSNKKTKYDEGEV